MNTTQPIRVGNQYNGYTPESWLSQPQPEETIEFLGKQRSKHDKLTHEELEQWVDQEAETHCYNVTRSKVEAKLFVIAVSIVLGSLLFQMAGMFMGIVVGLFIVVCMSPQQPTERQLLTYKLELWKGLGEKPDFENEE